MILAQLTILSGLIFAVLAQVVVNPVTGIVSNNLMFTGTIDSGAGKLFFTYYGINGETDAAKLSANPLIVAVGTPGRSAQYINLGGIGPKTLKNDMTLMDNPNSLTEKANLMFLDSLGSGFSFVDSGDKIPTEAKAYGDALTKALNAFISGADIGKSKNIYLIGESTFLRSLIGLDDVDPLQAIFHVSPWFDFYELGKYYGTGGLEMKIFTDIERITIESTFVNCFNQQRSSKFQEAHQCYDTTLNYIESKTKNINLMNVKLQSNLTDFLPMIQYYFSQSSVVTAYKAPNQALFDSQSPWVQSKIYADLAKNMDTDFSRYLKDYLSVKNIFISGDDDFICYRKAVRYWLENTLTFVESAKFKPLNLTVNKFNNTGIQC